WAEGLGLFDVAVCFSMLHHIPGARRRLRLMQAIRSVLKPGHRCAVSVWQFLHVPRLARKVVAWSEIGLQPGDVDAGDYLLDWRRGGRGLRYVHHFEEAELTDLCRRAGFDVVETFRSDGQTGNMGLYILLKAVLY
ncbi:MAG TPA: class I SAM-dependent methyltransferase, partial [Anaerolineae bacterium]